jgi:hypothetical protein
MDPMADFDEIEALFAKLLAVADRVLSQSEQTEVRKFIDVGEYGLALETAVDIFVEEGKKPSADVVSLIEQLAKAMSMEPGVLTKRLSGAP